MRMDDGPRRHCAHCAEPILEDDQVSCSANEVFHFECWMRTLVGSVAHVEHRCSCFVPGSTDNDPPDMTARQAARATLEAYYRLRRRYGH